MITFLKPHPIGDAVRCIVAPPEGSTLTRVLRKTTDDIASETDPDAGVVYEGTETFFIDISAMVNGVTYFYRAFDLVGSTWQGSASMAATPEATAGMAGPDTLSLVRDRLRAGLKVEVQAGRLKHATGAIPVHTSPPLFDQTKWPTVSVHLTTDAPVVRGVGEIIAADLFDGEDWVESEGWLAGVSLSIIAWSLNPDERILLRLAVKKVLIGNLGIFAQQGLSQVEISQTDAEDMEGYSAPVYWAACTFTAFAPAVVTSEVSPITDVEAINLSAAA